MEPILASNGIRDDDSIDMRCKAHRLCSEHLGGSWTKISPREMTLEPISGGMSNQLFRCALPESTILTNGEPSQILLRLYGDHSSDCDMSIQLEIFKLLSRKELGPRLYGNFDDGRLEEFLPATPLTSDELMNSEISSIIAKKVATVHSLDVPIDRNNTWLTERLDEWSEFLLTTLVGPNKAKVLSAIKYNHKTNASSNNSDGHLGHSTKEIARKLLAIDFNREIKFLRSILDRTRSPIVFSHNDLHQGNILLAKYSKRRPTLEERIVLIDFEYCSYNYRGYDIANHFCEWCFEYDTPEYPHFQFSEDRFPSKSAQRNFIRHYVDQRRKLKSLSRRNSQPLSKNGLIINNSLMMNNSTRNAHRLTTPTSAPDFTHLNGGAVQQATSQMATNGNGFGPIHGSGTRPSAVNGDHQRDQEDMILDEMKPFLMAANLLWTLWCIKIAHSSSIKFGYWEHAMARWKLYSTFKSMYCRELAAKENGKRLMVVNPREIVTRPTTSSSSSAAATPTTATFVDETAAACL